MYFLKSGICLAILYGFYKLFLENESMHVFKRFYLLGALGISFLIPLITFTTSLEIPITTVTSTPVFVNTGATPFTEIEIAKNFWPFVLWGLYGLGVLYLSIKFGRNLRNIFSRIKNNPKFIRDSINHILLKTPVVPHTFLNYVFLNKQKFEAGEIPEEVIAHEHVHAKQKHSIDILVIELLQIVFWFNPLLYFIKRSIKLNHEFLADQAVLKQGVDPTSYQNLLLAFSSHATTPTLANSINYSFIKKRITVMKKQTSTQAIWLRSILLVPLVAILMYGFSTREVIQKEIVTEPVQTELQQEKATKAEIEEYNKLAKKYNNMPKDKLNVIKDEVIRFSFLYHKMTLEQRKNAEPFPKVEGFPGPPPAPPVTEDSNLNKDSWVKDFDESFQNGKKTSSSKSIIFTINDDESFNINDIPSTIENYKTTLKSLFKKFENIKRDEEIQVYIKSEELVKWSFIQEVGEELKKYNIETINVTSGILDDRNEKVNLNPPAPPTPPTPNIEKDTRLPPLPAPAPPAPLSDPIEYIKALHKSGAVFYIGPHQYNFEEVLEMAKKTTDLNIDISEYPKVNLLGC